MDPFHAFASYPTQVLSPQTVLGMVDMDVATALQRTFGYRQLAMVDFARFVLPTEDEIGAVFDVAAKGPRPAADLVAAILPERRAYVFRALVWMVKMGVLAVR
jgi:hypothetical protein